MYLCMVPSPTHIGINQVIKGRSGDTGLPDFMLWENIPKVECKSIRSIGEDLKCPSFEQQLPLLYKVYGIQDNVLHEYTLAGLPEQDVLFPISLKRYTDTHSTILYLNCILAYLRYSQLCLDPYNTAALSIVTLLRNLMAGNPELASALPPPHYIDNFLTLELPHTISTLLGELGFECLNYNESAAAYLIYNYGKDLAVLQDIFALRPPDDIITLKGCTPQNNTPFYGGIEKTTIMKYIDPDSNIFYNNVASIQAQRTANVLNLQYLDKSSHWYDDLDMNEVLETMFKLRNTDYNVQISDHMIVAPEKTMLCGYNPVDDASDCWEIIRSNIAMYNRQKGSIDPILKVGVCKTWLDEVFFTIVTLSGNVENWFINLSLFHLYTPSIIRNGIGPQLFS